MKAPSTPVEDLHLSVGVATAMRTLNVKELYELVQKTVCRTSGRSRCAK